MTHRTDPDETEGRRLYREHADALAKSQLAMAKGRVKLLGNDAERKPHKTMTPEEYAATPIEGWHEVCRNVDGSGGVGVRYLGETPHSGDERDAGT